MQDEFEIELSDGLHKVVKNVEVFVTQVDDESPRLTINNGLEVEINETRVITEDLLKVSLGFFK